MNNSAVTDSACVIAPVHAIAHSRSGDKGNRSNISVIARRPSAYSILIEQLTEDRVFEAFRHKHVTAVVRYELPGLYALNFVLDNALEGGVNDGLCIDGHGKTLSSLMLGIEILVPRSEIAADYPYLRGPYLPG
jgi:hypothetical protein